MGQARRDHCARSRCLVSLCAAAQRSTPAAIVTKRHLPMIATDFIGKRFVVAWLEETLNPPGPRNRCDGVSSNPCHRFTSLRSLSRPKTRHNRLPTKHSVVAVRVNAIVRQLRWARIRFCPPTRLEIKLRLNLPESFPNLIIIIALVNTYPTYVLMIGICSIARFRVCVKDDVPFLV
jgi:hypothetical protein